MGDEAAGDPPGPAQRPLPLSLVNSEMTHPQMGWCAQCASDVRRALRARRPCHPLRDVRLPSVVSRVLVCVE